MSVEIRPTQRLQFWLAELDQYDNAKLVDGSHDSEQAVHHALYLYQRLGIAKDRRFAVARVELIDVVADPKGANEDALDTLVPLIAAHENKHAQRTGE